MLALHIAIDRFDYRLEMARGKAGATDVMPGASPEGIFLDYLERHPEILIRGKPGEK